VCGNVLLAGFYTVVGEVAGKKGKVQTRDPKQCAYTKMVSIMNTCYHFYIYRESGWADSINISNRNAYGSNFKISCPKFQFK
jgi:hypothetical protein